MQVPKRNVRTVRTQNGVDDSCHELKFPYVNAAARFSRLHVGPNRFLDPRMASSASTLLVTHAVFLADRRKALAAQLSDLFKVPLQQLPFYARMTATLSQEYPDFGAAVGAAVVRKVKGLAKNKDATNRTLEPRIASARYLAELTKFRVVDPGAGLQYCCILFVVLGIGAQNTPSGCAMAYSMCLHCSVNVTL